MLDGLTVVELASDRAAYTGKLLADLGADVIVVEPPGGHASRRYGPYAGDRPDPEGSLWWWYYNTSKRAVVLDLATADGAEHLAALVAGADVVLEGEAPGALDALGLDHPRFRAERPELIWVSVTPFGRRCAAADVPMTDLTLLAGAGPVWSCGYDDHGLPPVRGGGNQALHIGGVFAAMGLLTAVLHRDQTGIGQHVDVSMHAAANVTTEMGSVMWLVAGATVQRQTGRHAAPVATMEAQILAADGRYVTTGFPPHAAKDYEAVLSWLRDLGLEGEFPEAFFLQMGIDRGGVDPRDLGDDAIATAIYGAGRGALSFIASRLPAYDFFIGSQERDIQCGIIYSPEEALQDPHFQARGFPVVVRHPEIGRDVVYPGAPFNGNSATWGIRRPAPRIGEHNKEILGSLDSREKRL